LTQIFGYAKDAASESRVSMLTQTTFGAREVRVPSPWFPPQWSRREVGAPKAGAIVDPLSTLARYLSEANAGKAIVLLSTVCRSSTVA